MSRGPVFPILSRLLPPERGMIYERSPFLGNQWKKDQKGDTRGESPLESPSLTKLGQSPEGAEERPSLLLFWARGKGKKQGV